MFQSVEQKTYIDYDPTEAFVVPIASCIYFPVAYKREHYICCCVLISSDFGSLGINLHLCDVRLYLCFSEYTFFLQI